ASAAPAGSVGFAPAVDGKGRSANSDGASGTTIAAVAANNSPNTTSVRPPSRPIAPTSVADAMPVTRSETTSGMTVIRIAFTQRVPTGVSASAASSSDVLPDAAMSAPPPIATPNGARTRALSSIRWPRGGSHHEIAAVDVERRAGDVARGLGGGEANEVGDFPSRPEARDGISSRESLEQLGRRVLVGQLGVDHARTHRVHGDAEPSELFRGSARQPEQTGLRRRVVGAAQRAHHTAGR